MARTKYIPQSAPGVRRTSNEHREAAHSTPARRLKPRVEYVEVSSDDINPHNERGVLAGVHFTAVLSPARRADAAASPIHDGEQANVAGVAKYVTRATRHGRTPVDYDMKHHPMDEVLRPIRSAKRRSGLLAHRQSVRSADDDDEDDEADLGLHDEESDWDVSTTGNSHLSPIRTVRKPQATRHSVRAQARKHVNYSAKIHPQDYALPGFQHKAQTALQSQAIESTSKERRRSGQPLEEQSPLNVQETGIPYQPRKKLKSVASSLPTCRLPRQLRNVKSMKSRKLMQSANSMDTDELIEWAIKGSQAQSMVLPTKEDIDGLQEDDDPTGISDEVDSSDINLGQMLMQASQEVADIPQGVSEIRVKSKDHEQMSTASQQCEEDNDADVRKKSSPIHAQATVVAGSRDSVTRHQDRGTSAKQISPASIGADDGPRTVSTDWIPSIDHLIVDEGFGTTRHKSPMGLLANSGGIKASARKRVRARPILHTDLREKRSVRTTVPTPAPTGEAATLDDVGTMFGESVHLTWKEEAGPGIMLARGIGVDHTSHVDDEQSLPDICSNYDDLHGASFEDELAITTAQHTPIDAGELPSTAPESDFEQQQEYETSHSSSLSSRTFVSTRPVSNLSNSRGPSMAEYVKTSGALLSTISSHVWSSYSTPVAAKFVTKKYEDEVTTVQLQDAEPIFAQLPSSGTFAESSVDICDSGSDPLSRGTFVAEPVQCSRPAGFTPINSGTGS
ncbi:hypothetical protein LTR62_005943 [Meristemomyces frigidus]|uniref:Uncharacterized protein n=1 Tax=Meristemomyces frigidus TaxID=1508187 RepID=A0AAN7TP09_9PEZI|nr:hypothetical protein LTR62_005943 [Meristemomyces frigidus]